MPKSSKYRRKGNLKQHKLRVINGISKSLAEIKEAKKSGAKLQPLKEFLAEVAL